MLTKFTKELFISEITYLKNSKRNFCILRVAFCYNLDLILPNPNSFWAKYSINYSLWCISEKANSNFAIPFSAFSPISLTA